MHVDEEGKHQLSNFHGKRNKYKVTESDHAKVELKLNLQFQQLKPVRNEDYNFKSEDCQKYFEHLTTNTTKFSMCFEKKGNFKEQMKQWQTNLKSCIVQSFPKIRSRKRKFAESHIRIEVIFKNSILIIKLLGMILVIPIMKRGGIYREI